MADVKISALPASTTPLAGTEVLPIVQSSTTKQVSVANLTAGRAVSASSLTLTTPLSVANGGTGLTSLTAGYIPYGNGTGAFGSSSNLQFDGSSLGIGAAPSYKLTVVAGSGAQNILLVGQTGVSNGYTITSNGTSLTHQWYNGGSEAMRIASDGSVGIGTSSPSGKLHVVGGRSWFQANSDPFALYLSYNTSITGMFVGANSSGGLQVSASSGAALLTVDASGNIYTPAGATNMTNGFFYMPADAGAPSGTPTAISGTVPFYYDTTNNKFYVYNGAWKAVTLA